MILADKVIMLRKQNGWSQEELAERLNISRQSVSKWESGAAIPDLDKIIKLSTLFGVSTDYLLKEENEELEAGAGIAAGVEEKSGRVVNVEEAETFLERTREFARMIGLGVSLCILSPVALILLAGLAETGRLRVSEEVAAGVGLVVLLVMVTVAVVIFILQGMHYEKYTYLETEKIMPGYGVEGVVTKRKEGFMSTFAVCIAVGVGMCILAVLPLCFAGMSEAGEMAEVVCTAVLLVVVAGAVYLFVWAGIIRGGFDKLLQMGEYTAENKSFNRKTAPVASIYWCVVVAIYLWWSFRSGDWGYTWVVWPVAGVLWGAVAGIIRLVAGGKSGGK